MPIYCVNRPQHASPLERPSVHSPLPFPVPLEPSLDCPDKRLSVSDAVLASLGSLKGDPNRSWCSALSGQVCFIRAMGYLGRVSTRDGSRVQLSPKCPHFGALRYGKTRHGMMTGFCRFGCLEFLVWIKDKAT